MDFKVLIADSAIADLKEIVEFVAQDNPGARRRNTSYQRMIRNLVRSYARVHASPK